MRSWYRNIPIGLIVAIGIGIYGYVQVSDSKKDSTTRSEDGAVIDAGKVGFEVLKIGDCAQHPNGVKPDENDEAQKVESYSVVPCTDLHDVEMYSTKTLAFTPYPGMDALAGELSDFCYGDMVSCKEGNAFACSQSMPPAHQINGNN